MGNISYLCAAIVGLNGNTNGHVLLTLLGTILAIRFM